MRYGTSSGRPTRTGARSKQSSRATRRSPRREGRLGSDKYLTRSRRRLRLQCDRTTSLRRRAQQSTVFGLWTLPLRRSPASLVRIQAVSSALENDRVSLKDEAIDIPFCAASLLGALQPDRLSTMLLSGDDDGLAARPLYAWPDPVRSRRPQHKADDSLLTSALLRLSSIEFDKDERGDVRARIVSLEEMAANEFQSWWEYTQASGRNSATSGRTCCATPAATTSPT